MLKSEKAALTGEQEENIVTGAIEEEATQNTDKEEFILAAIDGDVQGSEENIIYDTGDDREITPSLNPEILGEDAGLDQVIHGDEDILIQDSMDATEPVIQKETTADKASVTPATPAKKKARKVKTKNDSGVEVSDDTWKLVFAALRNNNPLNDFQGTTIEQIGNQKCIIIYIPDPVTGVKGILPEKLAGLREGEKLESLLSHPFLRVLPISVDQSQNLVVLNRKAAEQISAAVAWKKIKEGDTVNTVVMGVDRSERDGRAFKVYLDIDGLKAILPIGEVSHNYVDDIDYSRGQTLKAKVISKKEIESGDGTKKRSIVVSIKALTPDPWNIPHCVPKILMPLTGIITNVVKTGMFVRLSSGIEIKTPHHSLNYLGGSYEVGNRITVFPVLVDTNKRHVYAMLTQKDAERHIKQQEKVREFRQKKSAGIANA